MTWDFEKSDKDKGDKDKASASEAASDEQTDETDAETSDALEAALEGAMPAEATPGDIVKGIVAAVDGKGVSVDVGSKYEGIIPMAEFPNADDAPRVDEEIEVAVMSIDEEKGIIRLSKRRADYERVWNRLTQAAETGEVIDAMVTDRVKGGLRVDVGVPGFVPGSQVASRNLRNLERFVGQSVRLKVLEADRQSKKVILSHRQVIEEEREKRREETLSTLEEGMVCEGKVRSLTNYGAFIDLGGVDGLLHISELAWTRVKHPSEVLKVGDTVRVAVTDIDRANDRISLSRRQILPDPWKEAAAKIKVGSVIKSRITRVVRTGAFAQLLTQDIEGFIPISEMSTKRIAEASDVVKAGQEVDLKVIDVRASARRMTLSLVAADQEKERQEYREYMASQNTAKVTLGDQFGAVLQQAAMANEADEEEAEKAEAPDDAPQEQVEAEAEAAAGAAAEDEEPEAEEAEAQAADDEDAEDEDDDEDDAEDEDEDEETTGDEDGSEEADD